MAADPLTASNLRHEFDEWLRVALHLPDGVRVDIVLAVYEAVANATEHAYRAIAPPHTMSVDALYDVTTSRLAVTVSDHGQWHRPDPCDRHRGRGLALIKGLADSVHIETTSAGTCAEMQWECVSGARAFPPAPKGTQ